MPFVTIEAGVFVELKAFETNDLIEELKMRGYEVHKNDESGANPIQRLYELKRLNDPRFDKEFAEFIYNTLGKVV